MSSVQRTLDEIWVTDKIPLQCITSSTENKARESSSASSQGPLTSSQCPLSSADRLKEVSYQNNYQVENGTEHNIEDGINSAVIIVHESERNPEYEWKLEGDHEHLVENDIEVTDDELDREPRNFTHDHNYNSSIIVTNILQKKAIYVRSKHRVQYVFICLGKKRRSTIQNLCI